MSDCGILDNKEAFGYVVSFTWQGGSRHNETWKAVGMSIRNMLGKPLDADLGCFKT